MINMGLDMYLYKKIWLSDFSPHKKEQISKIKKIFDNGFEPKEISFEIGYWRKANAIHKWFVDNVQDGKDDCGKYEVSYEQLIELKELCDKILQAKDDGTFEEVKEELKTTSGSFFGGTDYDEWYFDNLKDTVKIINKITKNKVANKLTGKNDYGSYEYYSSW